MPQLALSMEALSAAVKAEARRLGFELAGVASPEPPPSYPAFEAWLAAGRHGEMAYLASERSRQRRADPRRILPECQSILALGLRYPAPPEPDAAPGAGPRGRVASYAWGQDYHSLIPPRLEALHAFIEARAGHPVAARAYTDSGPLLERDLAQRAGLGWIGKNACLIHPRHGSYFLLAELLLDLPLPPDPPFAADHCGSCTRCLEACPTACILPNRTLDARRCLAYLTIELKGPLPLELRPAVGQWIFGCDVCQIVCPWNRRFASSAGEPAFAPGPGLPFPDLIETLSLDSIAFNRRFKDSPLQRPRRRGLQRNAALALGNWMAVHPDDPALPQAVAALAQVLSGAAEPLARQAAAWALAGCADPAAGQALQAALPGEADPAVQAEIRLALRQPPAERPRQ
jgi:epoxyqueuosine reductase